METSLLTVIKNIYESIADEQSKKIYESRLLYSLTGSYKFIDGVVSLSFKDIEVCKDILGKAFMDLSDDVVVYGAGHLGYILTVLCDMLRICAFCDSDTGRHGSMYNGYKVLSPHELKEKHSGSVIIIATAKEGNVADITEKLLGLGFDKDRILDFHGLLQSNGINQFSFHETQYFDPEIVLPILLEDEVFIDAGCYDCHNSIQFAKLCNNRYEKIIAFEPNPKQYSTCQHNSTVIENFTLYKYGLWNENAKLSFINNNAAGNAHFSGMSGEDVIKIEAVRLDDILNGEKASFIKMDVEGAELNALKGAEKTIMNYHPKLAISLYHKPEDVWEIPAYILSLDNSYKLYLRHYSFYGSETVLYAV
ncbi:MAG: FkbM family methyltransferase [Oscillospiraceae bacterium]|nr:FkbM family methyltransferase [Oscillospiraceae bacterium]